MWCPIHLVWPRPYSTVKPPDYPSDDLVTPPTQYLPLATTLSLKQQADIAVQSQSQSPLFKLPREIRNDIWRYATATYCDPDRPFRHSERRPELSGPRRCDTALLRTCREIYLEAWDLPLRQTPFVVHEGYQDDRGDELPAVSLPTRPGMILFCLQAWQLLLIQHVEMCLYQRRMEGGGIGEWLGKIGEAREFAKGIVQGLMTDGETAGSEVVEGILKTQIKDVSMRMNRRDWTTWAEEPRRPESKDSAKKQSLACIFTPGLNPNSSNELSLRIMIGPGWTSHHGLLSPDFTFTLLLETFGAKRDQLDKVVTQAKRWQFQTPRREDGSVTSEMMVWDGEVHNDSWQRDKPETRGWMGKMPWRKVSKRIEVRRIRFVRERDVCRPPSLFLADEEQEEEEGENTEKKDIGAGRAPGKDAAVQAPGHGCWFMGRELMESLPVTPAV